MKALPILAKAATAVKAAVGIAAPKRKPADSFSNDMARRAEVNADAARARAERESAINQAFGLRGSWLGGRAKGWLRR